MARSDWKRPTEFSAPEGRRRVALEVSYDGRAFNGWQTQDNGISVQETLKQAIIQFLKDESVVVCGSGRTDSGVHAKGQVAHVEFNDCTIPAKAFNYAVNALLPHSVRVVKSWDCGPSFHARYSAMAREYRYFAVEGLARNPFTDGLIARFKELPPIEVLNSYASQLIGTHDFTTFASAKDICPSKVRDIYESVFYWTSSMYEDKVLCYKICGNAFLYHMVRSLVGSMISMGLEGYSASDFASSLAACDRSKAKKTADSDGLYLWRVSYDPEEYRWFEEKYGNG